MKYSELDATIVNLRECADWLESNPRAIELPAMRFESQERIYEYAKNADGTTDWETVNEFAVRSKMRQIAKALRNATKDYSGHVFRLTKTFGDSRWSKGSVTLDFTSDRNAICRKVVKETKLIPERTEVYPARTEEVVEWVCDDALLASK
jgi:hypothetical protein